MQEERKKLKEKRLAEKGVSSPTQPVLKTPQKTELSDKGSTASNAVSKQKKKKSVTSVRR